MLAGKGQWILLPLQLFNRLYILRIQPGHVLIAIVVNQVLDIISDLLESNPDLLGNIYYQILPHLHQLPILCHKLLLQVLVPFLEDLFQDRQLVYYFGM